MPRPLTFMRMDTDVYAAVAQVAARLGLGVGPTVELICAEHLGLPAPQPRALLKAAVRDYRAGRPTS